MSEQREVHRVLCEARNLIAEGGWCQHALWDFTGAHCARGGIRVHAPDDPALRIAADHALIEAIGQVVPRCTSLTNHPNCTRIVVAWNNDWQRTKDEVLAAFDRAIQATAPEPDTSFLEAQDTTTSTGQAESVPHHVGAVTKQQEVVR